MSEMICVVKKLNERAKKIKKTKKRPKVFKYTSSQCKTTHFIRKRLSTKINRKLLKDKHFVPKKDDSKETSGLARKKSGYLDSCSAASTASPSSLGHVKVGLLPTHSPAPPFKTQLPHPWTAAKKRPTRCCSKSCWPNQSLRSSGDKSVAPPSLASVWLVPPRVLHSDTPGPAGKICPERGRRCHSLRLLLLSYLNHRPRPRWERRATAMTLGSRAMTQPRTKG